MVCTCRLDDRGALAVEVECVVAIFWEALTSPRDDEGPSNGVGKLAASTLEEVSERPASDMTWRDLFSW